MCQIFSIRIGISIGKVSVLVRYLEVMDEIQRVGVLIRLVIRDGSACSFPIVAVVGVKHLHSPLIERGGLVLNSPSLTKFMMRSLALPLLLATTLKKYHCVHPLVFTSFCM